MKLILIILCLFITLPCYCCTCGVVGDFKSKDDLKAYDFVALVSIKELSSLDTSDVFRKNVGIRKSGEIKFNVIEIFKGDTTTKVYDENFQNDCTFTLTLNEQWILFGQK